MKITTSLILVLLATAATAANRPLAFPQAVEQPLGTNKVQILQFTATNLTSEAVFIVGYEASCGCTSLDSKSMIVPPHSTLKFRAQIARTHPAMETVTIQDDQTNRYTIMLKVGMQPVQTIGNAVPQLRPNTSKPKPIINAQGQPTKTEWITPRPK
jgi:Protein of unknown function (DUF1573)